ncbi:hypothetical protein I5Q39_16740, partial [Serratia marcescens]|nr:hypothetical protein [Serratia marcescens]
MVFRPHSTECGGGAPPPPPGGGGGGVFKKTPPPPPPPPRLYDRNAALAAHQFVAVADPVVGGQRV